MYPMIDKTTLEHLERARQAVVRMWEHRDAYDGEAIPSPQGRSFGCPVVVDLGDLATAETELMAVMHRLGRDRR